MHWITTQQVQEKSKQFRKDNNKQHYEEKQRERMPQVPTKNDNYQAHTSQERCSICGDSKHIERFSCPASKHQCKICHKYGHVSSLCFKREKHLTRKGLWSKDHPKHINFRLVPFTGKIPYVASHKIYPQAMILSACSYSCNLHRLRPRSQHHIILLPI